MASHLPDRSGDITKSASPGLSPSRLAQLQKDLLLTPEERVLAAQATLNLDRLRRDNVPGRVIGFDTYDAFLDYKWKQSAGGG